MVLWNCVIFLLLHFVQPIFINAWRLNTRNTSLPNAIHHGSTACINLRGLSHEVIIEKSLSLGEATPHNMLIFLGHLLLHINLDPPEQERPQHLVKPLDQAFIVLLTSLNHPRQWVGEPFFELTVGLKDVGHEEVHQGPQLHQTILEGGASQQQAPVAAIRRGQYRCLFK